jgi:hypothetical protein
MIFESPDGGRSVFVRPSHTVERVDITDETPETLELNHLWFQWRDILRAAKHNPELKKSLDRAHIIYELSRNDKN